MDQMMEGSGTMMWGMGLFWLLALVFLVLGIAALVKYLFFRHPGTRDDRSRGGPPGSGGP